MRLSEKYDKFYDSSLTKEQLPEILIKGWPKDRFQAIVAMDGQGENILDIGCGDGYLLHQFRNRFKKLKGLPDTRPSLGNERITPA